MTETLKISLIEFMRQRIATFNPSFFEIILNGLITLTNLNAFINLSDLEEIIETILIMTIEKSRTFH